MTPQDNQLNRLRLDHIAIAVNNLDEALSFYHKQLGIPLIDIEIVEEQGVRVAKLDLGNTHIELLEPLSADTAVGKFLAQKGPGLHHVCIGVKDIAGELINLQKNGSRLIDQTPRIGASGARIAFVHPKATGGVLMELSEPESKLQPSVSP